MTEPGPDAVPGDGKLLGPRAIQVLWSSADGDDDVLRADVGHTLDSAEWSKAHKTRAFTHLLTAMHSWTPVQGLRGVREHLVGRHSARTSA